tara:strand:+ start:147 stop:689 length:543 start_codon:yes stop_codon:yes gene_type:complete
MITVRDFRYTDYKLVQELIPEFKKRRLNYDIDYINIEKMLRCLMFFNNEKLAMISGIDDISEFVPNTFRILTKAITTKHRPKCWGEYFEERLFSNVMAGISIEYCHEINDSKDIVITTNYNSRIDLSVKKSKRQWLIPRNVVDINDKKQTVWEIDIMKCKKMTDKWIKKLSVMKSNLNTL